MDSKITIKLKDGEELKRTEEAEYLGGILKERINYKREIQNRISKALKTCHKLKTFWKQTNYEQSISASQMDFPILNLKLDLTLTWDRIWLTTCLTLPWYPGCQTTNI